MIKYRPLPKSTTYKCDKCQIHFVSCVAALRHSEQCVSKRGGWECEKCRRAFKPQDREYHNHQHGITEDITVLEISDSILDRLLCKCSKCNICFDETNIMNFHTDPCTSNTPSVRCTECHIWLCRKTFLKHRNLHTNGFTVKDFIIIDYVHNKPKQAPFVLHASKESLLELSNLKEASIDFSHTKQSPLELSASKEPTFELPPSEQLSEISKSKETTLELSKSKETLSELSDFRETSLEKSNSKESSLKPSVFIQPRIQLSNNNELPLDLSASGQPPSEFSKEASLETFDSRELPSTSKESYFKLSVSKNIPQEIAAKDKIMTHLHRKYFYCPTCQCFLEKSWHNDIHAQSKCNPKSNKYICKLCGLQFASKTFKDHKIQHEFNPKLKLSDFNFFNIQTGNPINPPFPDFHKCRRCNVHFFNLIALEKHVCNFQEPKTCLYCDEIFSDLAYNLHVPFHQYSQETNTIEDENVSILLKKYQSLEQVWNILFLCKTCAIVTDIYDEVVEHCQDHFCNTENITIEQCKICDLNLIGNCYRKHKELHTSNDINRDSFKILEYNYETLLSDSWLDIFNTLTKEQVDFILSKSMYRLTRCVRMMKVADGPLSLTLYQCGVCKLMVSENKIAEHSQNQNTRCIGSPKKFMCSICTLPFATKNHKIEHENLHEGRRLDDKSFRIIMFVADKQFEKNDWPPKEHSEALKFIRCPDCGKLINKQEYKAHSKYHLYYNKTKAKPIDVKHKKIIHNFYKCRDCKITVSKRNIEEHMCTLETKTKCKRCSLWFTSRSITSHKRYHNRHKFSKKNITVWYFGEGGIEKKPIPKLVMTAKKVKGHKLIFYECENCSTCIVTKSSISRHSCPSAANMVWCDICGLTMYSAHMRAHKALHKIKKFSSKDVTVYKFNTKRDKNLGQILEENSGKIDIDNLISNLSESSSSSVSEGASLKEIKANINKDMANIDTFFVKKLFFLCSDCKLLFVTFSSLLSHLESCLDDRIGIKCNDCGLVLQSSAIKMHKTLQRCKRLGKVWIVTFEAKEKYVNLTSTCLYLCPKCDIYFVSLISLLLHSQWEGQHFTGRAEMCNYCHIFVQCKDYKTHFNFHHENHSMTFSDFTIVKVEDMQLDELKDLANENDVRILHESIASEEEENKEICKTIDEKKVESVSIKRNNKVEPSPDIYNCDVCGLNFLCMKSLTAHQYYGKHDQVHHSCPECGLNFTLISLKKHTLQHHSKKYEEMENHEDQNSSKTLLYLDPNNSIIESIPQMLVGSDADEKEVCASPNLETKNSIKAVPESLTPSTELTPSIASKDSRLFRCSLCDVYYLTADACLEHTSDHVALDPTEYIACKICDLQFPCEYLGNHTRGHRNKTFYIDELIVADFYPTGGGQVKIDTYLAADRLKSTLVSTTTQ